MNSLKFVHKLQTSFTLAITIAVWLVFAPTQLGGTASYIIVIGDSMEPKFHKGDLVIVHQQPLYDIGDAIVYRNLEVASFVFHRIISQQLGHYTLKGDNNTWVDNYKPTDKEVIGKLWLHIPGAGSVIQKIRSPFAMALMAGVLGAALAIRLFPDNAKGDTAMNEKPFREQLSSLKRTWQKSTAARAKLQTPFPLLKAGEMLEGSFFVLGLTAVLSLLIGMVAISRPVSRTVQEDISYQHLGVFAYSASTSDGVYDANTIKSGDPIFTKLTCSVDVNFTYSLVSGSASDIGGTYQLTAIILGQANGWQRRLPLQEPATFKGTTFGTSARLDLCQVQSLVETMEKETDIHTGLYTLLITPNIELDGNISERSLESSFNPPLTFRYDRLQFYVTASETQPNPMTFTETGILQKERQEANTILLLGKELRIPTLRMIALAGLMVSTGGLALLGLQLQSLSRFDQEKFFRMKYDSIMIDVRDWNPPPASNLIDIRSMEALAKLAERFHTVILHKAQQNAHAYFVQHEETTYRFMLEENRAGSSIPEAVSGIAD